MDKLEGRVSNLEMRLTAPTPDAAFGTGYVLTEYERTHTAGECVEHDKTELKADLSRALTERDEALARVKVLESTLTAPVVLTLDESAAVAILGRGAWGDTLRALLKRLGVEVKP